MKRILLLLCIFTLLFTACMSQPEPEPQPTAHKLTISDAPCVVQKDFSNYGITIEDDGDTIWLYATDATFTKVFCAVYISVSGGLKNVEAFIVHNAALKKVGLYLGDQFCAVIDFHSKKACARSGLGSSSAAWGNISFTWDNALEHGLEP